MTGQIYEIIQKLVIDKLQHAIDTGEKFKRVKLGVYIGVRHREQSVNG